MGMYAKRILEVGKRTPAGMPYEDRIAVFQKMDKHIKSVGGKLLKDGFWNATPRPYETSASDPVIEEDAALPF